MSGAARRVLLIIGDTDAAFFAAQALVHPEIETETFAAGEDFAGDLAARSFDVSVVGGTVGSRGPFVLCEAVRMTRQVPIVVLVDSTTNPRALAAHQRLKAELVDYLDFDGFAQPDGSLVDVGVRLRAQVLERLALAEDPETAAGWRARLEKAQSERDAAKAASVAQSARAPASQQTPASAAQTAPSAEGGSPPGGEEAPPFLTQMVDDDLDFANRIVERTRSVDFRSEIETAVHAADSSDAKTHKLRERIRELERQLARLAFIYRTRQRAFDGADETAAGLEQARKEAEGRIVELQQQYRSAIQQQTGATQQREQEYKAMLAQAEQAFNQLKMQSEQAIQQGQQEAAARQHELDTARAHIEDLRGRVESAVTAQSLSASQREELAHQSVERERQAVVDLAAAEQRLAEERQARASERAEWAERVDLLTAEVNSAGEQLGAEQAARQESDADRNVLQARVAELETELEQERRRARDAAEDVATAWAEKSEKLKESAATFRDAYHEHEQAVRDRDATIQGLNARLDDRVEELARLEKALSGKSGDVRELERVVDKGLKELRQQLGKQEVVLDTLAATHDTGPSDGSAKLDRWLGGASGRLLAAVAGIALVTGLAAGLVVRLATGAPAASGAAVAADDAGGPVGQQVVAATEVGPDALDAGDEDDTTTEADVAGVQGTESPLEPHQPAESATVEATAAGKPSEPVVVESAATDTSSEPSDALGVEAAGRSETEPPAPESKQAAKRKKPGSDKERRDVRQKMFVAFAKRQWAEAVEHGTRLRDEFHLDWEAAFKLGEAFERAKKPAEAVSAYMDFATHNATNKFADDAWFRAGAIYLKKGQKARARSCLEKAAASKGSNVAGKAKSLLRKLK